MQHVQCTPYSAVTDSACSYAAKGRASENCLAAGVIACCKLTGVTELCYYEGNESPIGEADCKAENGIYSTLPDAHQFVTSRLVNRMNGGAFPTAPPSYCVVLNKTQLP